MEIPKLFTEKVSQRIIIKGNEEEKVMERFLNTEIERQEYMEMRYKLLEEEQYKPGDDLFDETILEKVEKKEKDDDRKDDHEIKNQEAVYIEELKKLLEDLGTGAIN